MPVYIGNNKYNFSGFSKVFWGNNLVWQTSSGVTYAPILPGDTSTYPMYLKGWAKYTANRATNTANSGTVATIDTGVCGAYPSTCFASTCRGCENTKSLSSQPDKTAKYGFTTESYRNRIYIKNSEISPTFVAWNAYLASNPIDILFELEESDNSLWFAVTDETNYGYYCPATQVFCKVYGMTGTKIERVEYVEFDGQDCYVDSGIALTGSDSVTIDFLYNKSGSNIFGSWRSSNADVYTLYASTSKSYTRYGSSLYRKAAIPIDTRLTYRMTPTGNYVDGVEADTWTQLDFDSATPCLVGWLNGSGSPHLGGNVYDFLIDNKCHLVPVKIGTEYYLFDCLQWKLPTHNGTFGGGSVIDEPIEFPTSI